MFGTGQKIRTKRTTQKVMLTVFWDSGVVHREFLPKGCTIHSEHYIQTLKTLLRQLKHVPSHRPIFSLQHDNVQWHTSATTIVAIEELGFHVFLHPPNSLDLAPSHYLFFYLKKHLKSQRHLSNDKLKAAM